MNSDPVPATNCLAVRTSPMRPANETANLVRRICTGTRVSIVNGPTNDGTRIWWLIDDGKGRGWVSERRVDGTDVFLIVSS